jgi:hypothetical protein
MGSTSPLLVGGPLRVTRANHFFSTWYKGSIADDAGLKTLDDFTAI